MFSPLISHPLFHNRYLLICEIIRSSIFLGFLAKIIFEPNLLSGIEISTSGFFFFNLENFNLRKNLNIGNSLLIFDTKMAKKVKGFS